MAPGVGKTYRMLQEGRAEAESGHDVVIGFEVNSTGLAPYGRIEVGIDGAEIVTRTLTVPLSSNRRIVGQPNHDGGELSGFTEENGLPPPPLGAHAR